MLLQRNQDTRVVRVESIEGEPVYGGELSMRPMMTGDEMTLLELHYPAGVGAPRHAHSHESLIYVVSGRLAMTVGEDSFVAGPGDVCRHPAHVAHSVEALEDAVMVEVKAPAPDLADFFRLGAPD